MEKGLSMYYVISNSDGDTTVTPYSRSQLLEAINNEEFGSCEFLDEVPDNEDTNYWGENILIIKGDIKIPIIIETATKYGI